MIGDPVPFEDHPRHRWTIRLELEVEADEPGGSVAALRRVLAALDPDRRGLEILDAQVEPSAGILR